MKITIKSEKQRCGFGKILLLDMIKRAKEKMVKKIFLEVRRSNYCAYNFYCNMGFNTIGFRRNYYPNIIHKREDAIIMLLEI